ncbi:hypothetical protein PC116_g20362 [Phytophthora cactorum]|uniref:Uncharacterized protein n=1 Tax=Phytophthora cactorum TaxID=29920 RepID=A0A8T1KAX7_9STRA|nr:hypothetical protein PC112_g16141 [Phytophthora cactorum]KAG2851097.1 hypothetical protein PC113_g16215 [Phytophthora cactorum]KAG2902378.1 hypothetical protein PC115_g15620 [Phytophthora cactorum]KAG2965964.1 hypothetical protein PC118_g19439 [Phytophthora cactorum]KAG4231371.1 hypothetical protein PC116_g20362 [Phytophthora cactorum]
MVASSRSTTRDHGSRRLVGTLNRHPDVLWTRAIATFDRMVMQTARKASITFLARLLFFDTLPHRQKQQAVETAAAAGRPHRDQALTELKPVVPSAVVAVAVVAAQAAMVWQRYQAPFLGHLKAPWLQLISRRVTRHVGPSSEDTPHDVAGDIPE